jgi:uncharacterized repeat protein (TIGR01451 family)
MNAQKLIATVVFLMMLPLQAFAAADIKLSITPEKEVTVKENNREVKKRQAADTIEPGEVIFYTINYLNQGDEVATNVEVNNPIPNNTFYVSGSAKGEGAEITFSADDGKSFGNSSSVTYQVRDSSGKLITRKASPDSYTHIRWVITRIDPGKSGSLEYQVRVK